MYAKTPLTVSWCPFSSVQSLDWLGRRGDMTRFSRDPLSGLLCRRPLWAVLAWAGKSTLWCCPSIISFGGHGIAHPPRYPEKWFYRGCRSVWLARAIPALDSCQTRFLWTHKEIVDLAPHPDVGHVPQVADAEKFPQVLGFQNLIPIIQSQWAGSMFQSYRAEWMWQATCNGRTCLWS